MRDGTDYSSWAAPTFIPHYEQRLSAAAVFGDAALVYEGVRLVVYRASAPAPDDPLAFPPPPHAAAGSGA